MGGWAVGWKKKGEGDKKEKEKMNQAKDGLGRWNSGLTCRESKGGCTKEHNTQTESDKTMQPKLLIGVTFISTN